MSTKSCPLCGAQFDGIAVFCQRDGARLVANAATEDPFVGKTILGQFHIEEILGAGGMGTVYRARQATLERDVAVKILHRELTRNADAVRRFRREAKVATSLDHPHLVRVLLFGELPRTTGMTEGGDLYLIMELVRGRSLMTLMREEGMLSTQRAIHIAAQVCDAIGHAHDQGIVHRDVKPENIMVTKKHGDPDFVKVLDFGIARLLWDDQTNRTQSGVIFGTARYISPEGAAGEPTDARSDVYSIGVMTYQLLGGATPFEASSPVAMLNKHLNDPPPPLSSQPRGKGVPGPVEDVVMRALAKKPKDRWDTATQFADALRHAATQGGLTVPMAIAMRPSMTPTPTGQRAVGPQAVGAQTTGTVGPVPAGLRRGPSKLAVALAFVLGAGAVVGGVQLYRGHIAAEAASEREALLERARNALLAGHFDAPPNESVLALTGRLLEDDPNDAEARALQERATQILRQRAYAARGRRDADEERATWHRVLLFAPGDSEATEALADLDRPHPVDERAIGIHLQPEEPTLNEAATLLAQLDSHGSDSTEGLRFEVRRAGRRVARLEVLLAAPGRYIASYVFKRTGTYQIRLTHGRQTLFEEEVQISSSRRRTPVATQRRSNTTPSLITPTTPSMNPQPQPTMNDGIDWTLPDVQSQMTTMTPEPPPPWTG